MTVADGLRVETYTIIKLPVRGPGEGQRDAWSTHLECKLRGDNIEVQRPDGVSGRTATVKLSDLRQLVDALEPPRRRPPEHGNAYFAEENWHVFACPACGVWSGDEGVCPGDFHDDRIRHHAPVERVKIEVRAR
jgi:hypothetical protein